jgi:sugar phosphate isomerase/epimerase
MSEIHAGTPPLSRRGFLGSVAAAAAGTHVLASDAAAGIAGAQQLPRPNSTFAGVRLGINAPYSFHGAATTAEEVLAAILRLGLSWVELRGPTIEQYGGLAPAPALPPGVAAGQAQLSPEDAERRRAAQLARAEQVRTWRLSQSMDRFRDLRRMYESAGVIIDIAKFPDLDNPAVTDDEIEYIFEVAKAVGAYAITCEPPVSQTKRLGQFAARHRVMLGYHNHANVTNVEAFARPGSWEQAFFYSPFNGANVDIGHWTAGNNTSPIPFIREYRNRITNLHIKDRRLNQGANTVWGEGDTPVAEVLRMMRDERDLFQATIELEYPIPPGSDIMTELARSVQFVRNILES